MQLLGASHEGHPQPLVDTNALHKVAEVPSAGPAVLCAWLATYAERLRCGIYEASRTRARSEIVYERHPLGASQAPMI